MDFATNRCIRVKWRIGAKQCNYANNIKVNLACGRWLVELLRKKYYWLVLIWRERKTLLLIASKTE